MTGDKVWKIKKDCLERQSYNSGAKGLEPSISGVTGQRDNQLRYAPKRLVYTKENQKRCQVVSKGILK